MPHLAPNLARASLAIALLLAACAAQQQAGTKPAATTAPKVARPSAAVTTCAAAIPEVDRPHDGEWETWTHEQKVAYMKDAVLPTEAPLFREYSSDRFAELTCRSCHGAGADDGTYAMPNPALPKIAPGRILAMQKTNPRVFRFMYDVVTPRTAALLNEPEWSHKTMSGFGCFKCHPLARDDAGP
jgi:hypothetical protein